jgi:hypothetical protein
MDADGFKNFFIQGFILIFKDEVLMYMTQNALLSSYYSLKPLGNHKWLLSLIFFGRWCITSDFPLAACEFLWRILRGRL